MVNLTKKIGLQIGNILAFIATLIVNFLANSLPLNGITTGELSDLYPNLFVPDGYVFSIWGVIYILLAIFSIYQAKDIYKSEKEDLPFIEKISYFFILGSLGNIAWIFFWHYQVLVGALIAILVLFFSLLLIYLQLKIGISDAPRNEKIFIHLPISVYFGWLTVATVAQITALLVDLGIPSFGTLSEVLTIVVIIVVVVITLLILLRRKDIAYGLVVVWASIGIFTKQLPTNLLISITALIAALVLAIFIIYTGYLLYKER